MQSPVEQHANATLTKLRPRYEVVYAIIDGPVGSKLDLPFFSKVNLRICGSMLENYGFAVSLLHIPESAKFRDEKKKEKLKKNAEAKVSMKTAARRPQGTGKT